MKKEFIEKVLRERIVDTKQYRYVAKVKDGKQYINRLPVADLDTTAAIDGWETVWSEKMKQYRIKDDRRESWGDGWESVVTEDEVRRLANEWGVSFDDLLDDLEEI